jgi:hypothetical protein
MTISNYKTTTSTEEFIKRINALSALKDQDRAEKETALTFHVDGMGKSLVSGYESLRNAAEYSEGHAMFQPAIVRFFVRNFSIVKNRQTTSLAKDLIVELTLAGYIENDSVTEKKMEKIQSLVQAHWEFYKRYESKNINLKAYVFGPLSAKIEEVLFPHSKGSAIVQFAYEYFAKQYGSELDKALDRKQAHLTLLIAVMKALIKPTEGAIREDILSRYRISIKNSQEYLAMNRELDVIFKDRRTRRVERKISNRCTPFRVLLRQAEKSFDVSDISQNRARFMSECNWTIKDMYDETSRSIRSGVLKSIIFLIITKTILGIAIEVPSDLLIEGHIVWLPLIINLAFPPIYMLILSFTLTMPGEFNTRLLERQIEDVLYEDDKMVLSNNKIQDSVFAANRYSRAFNFFYWAFFLAIIALVSFVLIKLHFSVASFIIFFVFVSTASFLCFRLSRLVREVTARSDNNQSMGQSVRDFLYMPFVVIGQWVTEKYAKINIVSNALDLLVELPLKDVLRMIRRWNVFLSSKKDEL